MVVLYIVIAVIAIVLIIPLFISKDMNYEKSILINAEIDKVWENVSTLSAMDAWSPWDAKDPNVKKTLMGKDGEPGARQSWVSASKEVGEGSQTIVTVDKPNELRTKLEFIKPFKSEADAYVRLEEEGDDIKTTWGFESSMSYPMNIMKLFMNFEKSMDRDFGAGLSKLKNICES